MPRSGAGVRSAGYDTRLRRAAASLDAHWYLGDWGDPVCCSPQPTTNLHAASASSNNSSSVSFTGGS